MHTLKRLFIIYNQIFIYTKFLLIVTKLFPFFRIQNWRTDTSLDRIESDLLNSDLCTACGHRGKLQKHKKSGCADCGTVEKCNDNFR